jgi:D-alanine-D-alanine ligase
MDQASAQHSSGQRGRGNSQGCGQSIAVAYTRVSDELVEDQREIIDYAETVARSLSELGYEPVLVGVTLDLGSMVQTLANLRPRLVFNLVEALYEHDRLLPVAPMVFEAFRIPYTGVDARGHFLTTDKILTKELLQLAGIATPLWQRCDDVLASGIRVPVPCIVKPVAADASIGMDETSVCRTAEDLLTKVHAINPGERPDYFAELFIEGREFNLSVLAMENGVHVLPPAEMQFKDYPPGKPTIVDYKAKWDSESFEFSHTVRRFDFTENDNSLIEELKSLTLRCWSLFRLNGYARVDFRIDTTGRPWVLEINANPCISPDAGFVAAAQQSGLTYTQLIKAIVNDGLRRETMRGGEEAKISRHKQRKTASKKQ